MFFTYVLISKKDKKLYTDWTVDLKKRMNAHNKGEVDATKYLGPFKLIYYEACLDKNLAIERKNN